MGDSWTPLIASQELEWPRSRQARGDVDLYAHTREGRTAHNAAFHNGYAEGIHLLGAGVFPLRNYIVQCIASSLT